MVHNQNSGGDNESVEEDPMRLVGPRIVKGRRYVTRSRSQCIIEHGTSGKFRDQKTAGSQIVKGRCSVTKSNGRYVIRDSTSGKFRHQKTSDKKIKTSEDQTKGKR